MCCKVLKLEAHVYDDDACMCMHVCSFMHDGTCVCPTNNSNYMICATQHVHAYVRRISNSKMGQREVMRIFCKDLLKNKSIVELRYVIYRRLICFYFVWVRITSSNFVII